jgi:signal peptidase I
VSEASETTPLAAPGETPAPTGTGSAPPEAAAPPASSRAARLWREFRQLAVIAVVILTCRSVLADWYQVPTGSMKPTILEGDRVFVLKCAYQLRVPFTSVQLFTSGAPKRGDVIVLRNPSGESTPLVKRVVGLPGDVVELRNETLYVNGFAQALVDPPRPDPLEISAMVGVEILGETEHPVRFEPERPAMRWFGPVRVPEGHVFVMGDNRDDSLDGRVFGSRPTRDLLGKAVGILWSWNPDVWKGPRWKRFGRSLPTTPDGHPPAEPARKRESG